MAKKWEYKVVDATIMSTKEIGQELNSLGEKGWELVAVVATETLAYDSVDDATGSGGQTILYLKREKDSNNSDGDENVEDEKDE